MELVSAKPYRSKPLVNITDDRIRIVLDMKRNEWHEFRNKYNMPKEMTLKEYCRSKKKY